jgi:hypothetical protein
MKKLLALLMLVLPVMGMENEHSKTKAKYTTESRRTFLTIETESRTIFSRDYSGTINIDINPREHKIVKIGQKIFDCPKKIHGYSIEIGDFAVNKNQTDDEFIKTISNIEPISYILTHEDLASDKKSKGLTVIEVETDNKTLIKKHPNIVSVIFNCEKVSIGGRDINSPKRLNLMAHKIHIGNFILDRKNSENEFLSMIEKYDSILYKAKQIALD